MASLGLKPLISNDLLLLEDVNSNQSLLMGWTPAMQQELYKKLSGGLKYNSIGAALIDCLSLCQTTTFCKSHGLKRTHCIQTIKKTFYFLDIKNRFEKFQTEQGLLNTAHLFCYKEPSTQTYLEFNQKVEVLTQMLSEFSNRSSDEIFWKIVPGYVSNFIQIFDTLYTLGEKRYLDKKIKSTELNSMHHPCNKEKEGINKLPKFKKRI